MRPAPKARTGPWRRDSPCPREISGLYVTAWSEVRVLPPEPIHRTQPRVLGPIDTTVGPMFYRDHADLRELRSDISNSGRHRRAKTQPSRPQAMPPVSASTAPSPHHSTQI